VINVPGDIIGFSIVQSFNPSLLQSFYRPTSRVISNLMRLTLVYLLLLCVVHLTSAPAGFCADTKPDSGVSEKSRSSATERSGSSADRNLDDSLWEKVFDCEFDSPEDLKKWNVIKKWDNANDELQAYRPDAVTVRDGLLYIQAKREDTVDGGKQRNYTSGRMDTRRKFAIKYGRFDCRFKVPRGKGFWPAFWLLPESDRWPPEIDWMEILGHRPEIIEVTNHYGKHKNGNHPWHGPVRYEAKPSFADEFHTLTGIWNANEIICYVDGKQISLSHDGVPHEKMYLILNLAVGGSLPGSPDATTPFPSDFVVDFVRVYKLKN